MTRRTFLLTLGALSVFGPSALARVSFQKTLAIGGTELITLRSDSQKDLDRRVDIIGARLNEILGDPTLAAADVQIKPNGKETAIYVKDQFLITVTSEDAKYNMTTVENQAKEWCARLAEVLPTLKAVGIPPR